MKRIFFFATPADIVPVLQRWESAIPMTFASTGILNRPDRPTIGSSGALPKPGVATHETGSMSKSYLVLSHATPLREHLIHTRKGEQRWALYNGDNEDSVTLTMAGLWGDILLPGQVTTVHDTPIAQQLMKGFAAALRKEGFFKSSLWSLGPEALALYRAGRRLTTTAAQSPPEFDLRLPESV